MASWTLRPAPVVAGLDPALVAEEGVTVRLPRRHPPRLQGGKQPSTSTSELLPETRPEKDDTDAHQVETLAEAAVEAAVVAVAEAATTIVTTAMLTTTARPVPGANHDALMAVALVVLVEAAAAAAVKIPATATGLWR